MTRATVTAGVRPHAKRRQWWRLRGSIANLLRLLVAVPLLAVVAFAGLTLLGTVRQVVEAGDTQRLVGLASDAGSLAHALQVERAAAASVLTSSEQSEGAALEAFERHVAQTSLVIAAFEQHGTPTDAVTPTIRQIATGLENLATVRSQVRSSPSATLSSVSFSYRILIADLLALREGAVAAGASSQFLDDARAASALAQAGESVGQLQIVVLRSLAIGELTPSAQQESASVQARLVEAGTLFLSVARPAWSAEWERVGTDPQVITAQRQQDEVGRAIPGEQLALDVDEWVTGTNAWSAELYALQRTVDTAVADQAATARRVEVRNAAAQAGGILVAVALAAVLTSLVARRITRRLRRLRESANTAAFQRLPEVVRELNAAPPGTVSPRDIADRSAAGLILDGEDEIAEVGGAVQALHREAVRTAGEQVAMRERIAEMFVHLSRREQRLVDALLLQIDRVEFDETDPDRLQQLYELDHLATRMARTNQNLLVLGGSGTSRIREGTVPMVRVVQAALSQIEQYTRVWIGAFDDGLRLAGEAVDEIVHLLAELLDNATTYSSPETEVWVIGRTMSDRLIVQVVDEGVGLSAERREQINGQLAAPGAVEVAGVQAMGLIVVGRLAERWGVRVELRPGAEGGTVAEVAISMTLLSWSEPVTQADQPATAAVPFPSRPSAGIRKSIGATPTMSPSASVSPREQNRFAGPAPLFAPEASVDASPPSADQRTVNGWFRTALDGDDVVVTWPPDHGDRWAAALEQVAPLVAAAGLPQRIPQQQLVPDAPAQSGPDEAPRRLDPTTIAAAMSAYARGVAGHRAPSP